MKYITVAFCLIGLFITSACGIKPSHLSPPSGDKTTFPATYPADETLD